MKFKALFFSLLIAGLFACGSPTPKEQPSLQIDLNWLDTSAFFQYEIQYVSLNFDPFLNDEIAGKGIEEFIDKKSYILDQDDRKRLFEFVSDSSHFGKGECGTFALNSGFLFAEDNTINGIMELGCGMAQWSFQPYNSQALGGSLSDKGFEVMTTLLDAIYEKHQ